MKRRVLHALTLAQLRQFIGNSRTIRRFAESHDLVYFGTVNPDDEAKLVKGHTVSRTQRDEHYCVGTTYGRDMIFLQRTDTLRSSTKKRTERYTWNILAVDLAERMTLPHMYIEGKGRHGTVFDETFALKYREISAIPEHMFVGYDPLFAQRFTCRTPVAHAGNFPAIVSPMVAATLAHHFALFDYEWHNDVLYIYYLSSRPTFERLEYMVKCGVWLAKELERTQE